MHTTVINARENCTETSTEKSTETSTEPSTEPSTETSTEKSIESHTHTVPTVVMSDGLAHGNTITTKGTCNNELLY